MSTNKMINLKKTVWLLAAIFLINNIENVFALHNEYDKHVEKTEHNLEYVPGEIIIKLKPQHGKEMLKMQTIGTSSLNALQSAIGSTSSINDVSIISIEPVFKNHNKNAVELISMKNSKSKNRPNVSLSNIYCIKVDKGKDILQLCKELSKDPSIEYAEPNYICRLCEGEFPQTLPNDTYVDPDGDGEWSYDASWQDYEDMWGLKAINMAPEGERTTWAVSQGEGIVVAVVDTGIDYTHEDLESNIWINQGEIPSYLANAVDSDNNGDLTSNECIDYLTIRELDYNNDGLFNLKDLLYKESIFSNGIDDDKNGFVDDFIGWNFKDAHSSQGNSSNGNNDVCDFNGHGSHIAGTISAVGNNNKGVIGIVPKSKIMAIKHGSDGGRLSKSIVYAADNGAKIISNSWRIEFYSSIIKDVIDYAYYEKGCVIVAAAGNEDQDAIYCSPAKISEVITVANLNPNKEKSFDSNWGSVIDVIAPGDMILSVNAVEGKLVGLRNDDKYAFAGGTSMACPHVSGLAALILSNNNSLTNEQVNQIIRMSASDIKYPLGIDWESYPGWDIYTGYGLINAQKSLQMGSSLGCRISEPMTESVLEEVEDKYDIKGVVNGPNFESYSLEYKKEDEEIWHPIISNAPTQHTFRINEEGDIIFDTLGTFEIDSKPDGNYVIKLTARDTYGNIFEDRIELSVDLINFNLDREVYNNHETILIQGTAVSTSFTSYNIMWGEGENPVEWFSEGMILENDGMEEVTDGILGSLDSSVFNKAGWYSVKLQVIGCDYISEEQKTFYLDPEVLAGWPQKLEGTYWQYQSSYPVVGDVDGDGYPEVVWDRLSKSDYKNCIHIWNDDGEVRKIESSNRKGNLVALVNLDEDNALEIVSGGVGKISFFNADGSHVSEIWKNKRITIDGKDALLDVNPLIVSDIDNDGDMDIIAIGYIYVFGRASIFAWDFKTGELLSSNYPIHLQTGITQMALGDINNNGKKEIVVGISMKISEVHIYNSDGSEMDENFPVFLTDEIKPGKGEELCKIILANIGGDYKQEILIGTKKNTYAYDIEGNLIWKEYTNLTNYLALSDVDNDGLLEIVTSPGSSYDGSPSEEVYNINVLDINKDGNLIGNTELIPQNMSFINGISLADINNDGRIEMITSGFLRNDIPGKPYSSEIGTIVVNILNYNMERKEWTIVKSHYIYASPSIPYDRRDANWYYGKPFYHLRAPFIADLNKDGMAEIGISYNYYYGYKINEDGELTAVAGNYIQIWENNSEYTPENVNWNYRNYDLQNTSSYPFTHDIQQNSPPKIISSNPEEVDVIIHEGESKEFSVTAHDPDGDELRYIWSIDNSWIDNNTNTYTYTPGYDDAGYHVLHLLIFDGAVMISRTWIVEVLDANHPPEMLYLWQFRNNCFVWLGKDEEDKDHIKYSYRIDDRDWSDLTRGRSIRISEISEGLDPGIHKFYVKAIDSEGGESEPLSEEFRVVEKSANTPPKIIYLGIFGDYLLWAGMDREDIWKLKYSYRINNGEWSSPSKTNWLAIRELSLEHGEHLFEVKAIDSDGLESKIRSIRFIK